MGDDFVGEFDGPWKVALGAFFEPFMQLCFPDQHAAIDWAAGVEVLEQELQQLAVENRRGQRSVDKLVRVRLLDGSIECVLVHVEVQSQRQVDFAARMYEYYYRLVDKLQSPVVSLAVLGDANPDWRPYRHCEETLGCRLEFSFPLVKLLDFRHRINELRAARNPFAVLVLAHLGALETALDTQARLSKKLSVVRLLYQRGLSAEQVRGLFRVVDWMLDLPREETRQFWQQLKEFEMNSDETFITSTEQLWLDQGIEKGLEQGLEKGLEQGLEKGLEQGMEKGLVQGMEKGLEQGVERGVLMGRIRTLQEVLRLTVSSSDELAELSDSALTVLADELSAQFSEGK